MRRAGLLTALLALALPAPALAGSVFIVEGGGWGHGVGMSQWGAEGAAAHGWSYRRILAHFYPGATLQQWPALQTPEHVVEQLPQWFLSMFSSTHAPLQSEVPPMQTMPHAPSEQNWPFGHAFPQPLQFFESLCVSTHVVAPASPTAHDVQPDWHVAMHLLF